MTISITRVSDVTPELVDAMNRLLPELTSSASPPSIVELCEIVESPATVLFVARSDAQTIVGTLTLVSFRLPTGMRAWIEDVIVDSNTRGLGVGAALCQTAIWYATDLGAVSIDLTSRPSRVAANRLYQKLGFQRRETNVYRYTIGT
jgi:ribosomal protein S18 acetylase RimI-like enzyme